MNIATVVIPACIMFIATVVIAVGLSFAYQFFLQGQNPVVYHKTLVISWTVYLCIITFFFAIHFFDQLGKKVGIPRSYITDGLLTPLIWTIVIVAGICLGPFLFLFLAIRKDLKWKLVGAAFLVALSCFGIIVNFQNLPPKGGPYIVTPNHSSFIDYFLAVITLLLMGGRWNIVYGTNLHYIPVVGWLLKKYAIPVDRNDPRTFPYMKKRMKEELALGHNVLVFPESGRILIEEALTLRVRELACAIHKIAYEAGVEILPVIFSWPLLYRAKGGVKRFSPQTIGITFLNPRPVLTKDPKELIVFAEKQRLEMVDVLNETPAVKAFFNSKKRKEL